MTWYDMGKGSTSKTETVAHASLNVASGFIQLFGSQLLTRLLTFILNLATARSLSPEAYGIAAVQFHLINTSILFLSREGFRRGCLRIDPSQPRATEKVLGISLLTIPIGALLSFVVTLAVLSSVPLDDVVYRQAIIMQGLAAFLELWSEPMYILATVRLWFGVRVAAEAIATVAKNVATLFLLLSVQLPPPMAFSWGQLAYAAATFLSFLFYFTIAKSSSLSSQMRPQSESRQRQQRLVWDKDILEISGTFALQAFGKLLLAEGSKGVLATATPLQEQGVYGLVNNLGSLVVRTIFQPYEEVAFVAFSRSPATTSSSTALYERASLLSTLCRGTTLLGTIASAFGPSYSYLVLSVLYGSRWANSGAPAALALYSYYIAILAMNGILEAFVHAVADQSSLQKSNFILLLVSVLHIGLSVAGVKHSGAIGLLLADSANMALRIWYCLWFCSLFFKNIGGLRALTLLPSSSSQRALFASLVITMASQIAFMPETVGYGSYILKYVPIIKNIIRPFPFLVRAAGHVSVGVVCLGFVGFTVYRSEFDVVLKLRGQFGKNKAE